MAEKNTVPIPPEGASDAFSASQPYTSTDSPSTDTWQQPASSAAQQPYGAAAQQQSYTPPASTATTTQATKEPKKKSGGLNPALSAVIGAVVAVALIMGAWSFTPVFDSLKASGAGAVSTGSSGGSSAITIQNSEDTTTAEAVAAKCIDSVATIYVYTNSSSDWTDLFSGSSSSSKTPSALGSGVIVGNDGNKYYILTNYHVVENISKATVKIGEREYSAEPIGYDEKSDLAVIQIEGEGLSVAEWGDSKSLNVGEWVAAIGSPYGYEQTLTTGVVSALYRSDTISSSTGKSSTAYTDMIQTDASINPGNSGGGLFDSEGKLIGINTYISSTSESSAGLGFAIPQSNAQEVAEALISGKTVEHAYLGISMGSTTDEGVTIAAVYKDTGAAKAGLQSGDVITKIDDKAMSSASDVIEAVESKKVGDKMTITYLRDGKEATAEATLGSDTNSSSEYAENGAPQNQNNGNSGSGNSGSGNGWYGFDLDDLFGGNSPFGYGYGNSGSGNSGSGNSGSNPGGNSGNSSGSGSGSFWQ